MEMAVTMCDHSPDLVSAVIPARFPAGDMS
jgi:hypothetical protein